MLQLPGVQLLQAHLAMTPFSPPPGTPGAPCTINKVSSMLLHVAFAKILGSTETAGAATLQAGSRVCRGSTPGAFGALGALRCPAREGGCSQGGALVQGRAAWTPMRAAQARNRA